MSERKRINREGSQYASSTATTNGRRNDQPKKPSRSFSLKSQKPPEEKLQQRFSKALNNFLKTEEDERKLPHIRELLKVIQYSWDLPVIGRDLAYDLSDELRRQKVVTYLAVKLKLDSPSARVNKPLLRDIQHDCASLLEQILTTDNRHFIARNHLETIANFTKVRDDIDIIRINTGILEAMFKDSEHTCSRLIELGALDTVLHACRQDDTWTARHCSAALANATIFGGTVNHRKMVSKGAANWLFPLAFRTDDYCRFYACLAITVLASNPLVENAVVSSGTLQLVEPFVTTHDPYEFALSNASHAQGRAAVFLQRLIPLLLTDRPETQALASFYFAMEASIKAKQQKTQIFHEIAAIVPLKRVIATSRSSVARTLASRCMKIIGEEVPKKLSPQVHLWDMEDVQSWLTIAGFRAFHSAFRESAMDGEMLLLLTEKELMEDLHMTNTVHRKRFIRDLNRLRSGADYRSCDPSNICDWLRRVDPQFAQYTLPLVRAGIDRKFLTLLTEEHLKDDCGIMNGVHRTRILDAVKKIGTDNQYSITEDGSHAQCDVFISYRRKTGSHLASLIKVHLQLAGYKVFFDVESLGQGEFFDYTLRSIKNAKVGFVVILTPGSLDRCAIDNDMSDWLHKEIFTAISSRKQVVPVTTEGFQWPMPDQLPSDMKQICFFNGVKWVHDYQDACMEKIEKFLKGGGKLPGHVSRGPSIYGSRDLVNHSGMTNKQRNPQPNQVVRPSGSTDNLANGERLPRPRQRASPPGQASNIPAVASTKTSPAQSTASRDVAGSVRDSTRRLDQADGSAVPHSTGKVQYPPHPTSTSTPAAKQSPAAKSTQSVSSVSPGSTKSQSASSQSIRKDIVPLDQVLDSESSSQSSSESSEESSEYTSSSEGEEEVKKVDAGRKVADGKSSAPAIKVVTPQLEPEPKRYIAVEEKSTEKQPPTILTSSTASPVSSPEPRYKKSNKKYHAPPPPSSGDQSSPRPQTESSVSSISPVAMKRKQAPPVPDAKETNIDESSSESEDDVKDDKKHKNDKVESPVDDIREEIPKKMKESSSDSEQTSSSGEEEFHSTGTRNSRDNVSMEAHHESEEDNEVSDKEESTEHESSSSSEDSHDEEETIKESDKEEIPEKKSMPLKDEIIVLSDTEVFHNENYPTLPHTDNKLSVPVTDNKLSESDYTESNNGESSESSDEEKEKSDSSDDDIKKEKKKARTNADGTDSEKDAKYISSNSSKSSRNTSSSAPSELDVEPMKVMDNVGIGSVANANMNNSNNISSISPKHSTSDEMDGVRKNSPHKSNPRRVDIVPTVSDLQYSPRRSPTKMVTHPTRMGIATRPGYMPPNIPPYQGSHIPPRHPQFNHPIPPQQRYQQRYPKPMTSASLEALYPPHPSMQPPPVTRAGSRGSLRNAGVTDPRLRPHNNVQGFDTAV